VLRQILFLTALLTTAASCEKASIVLRDPGVYRNEVAFFQMALEQDTELLATHLADGSCTCDADGSWSSDVCESTALNVLVIRSRLSWHLEMMKYFIRDRDERPPEEPPEVPETSTLCPKPKE
jgi:hypothetical protein